MVNNQDANKAIRPTKKQRELLSFIADFINEHGYSPSYREIMKGLNYNSVATVSLHINSLISRGHLRKRERSARSLEVVEAETKPVSMLTNEITPTEEKWLVDKVEYAFRQVEQSSIFSTQDVDNLYVLVGALKVLGLEGASLSFQPRLKSLKPQN